MNMRHDRRLSPGMLAGAPAVALVALAAGCTASHAAAQPRFQQMQPAAVQWDGAGYVTILGPVTGTGTEALTVSARPGMSMTLGCIGTGVVWVKSQAGSFAAACADDGGTFAGGQNPATHLRPGQKIAVQVVAAAGTRWELRIDGTPQRG
jgi:hypothetical protein